MEASAPDRAFGKMRPILIPLQDLSQTAKNHIGCLIFIFSQEYGGLMKVVLKIFQHHSIVVSRVLREAFNWAPIMSDGSDTSVSDGLFFFRSARIGSDRLNMKSCVEISFQNETWQV